MKFTEREMTVGVEAAAKRLHAASGPPWKRGRSDDDWRELAPMAKYQHKAAAGEMVLPALVALPERPTVGARPEFSDAEYAEAAEAGARALVDAREPGSWDRTGEKHRARLVQAAAEVARVAVEAMPVRQDPDALVVPDYLE